MKDWISQRIQWMDQQFLAGPTLAPKPGAVDRGTKLVLKGQSKLYYTLDGSDPRASGGAVSATAHAYSGGIVLDQNANVVARVFRNNQWSYPTTGKFTVR
jgi:hypothetical protein